MHTKTQRYCSQQGAINRSIHLPISRESINESYCEQAFRLIDQRILPPSQGLTSVTLQVQALCLWKNTPYLRLRDSMGITPIFLSSHNGHFQSTKYIVH